MINLDEIKDYEMIKQALIKYRDSILKYKFVYRNHELDIDVLNEIYPIISDTSDIIDDFVDSTLNSLIYALEEYKD